MLDPKDNLSIVPPKKGNCYMCGAELEKQASLQVQMPVPLVKMKKVLGRGCVPCATELKELLDLMIAKAKRGEYQA